MRRFTALALVLMATGQNAHARDPRVLDTHEKRGEVIAIIGSPQAATVASITSNPSPNSFALIRGALPFAASHAQPGSSNSGRNPTPFVRMPRPTATQATYHHRGLGPRSA